MAGAKRFKKAQTQPVKKVKLLGIKKPGVNMANYMDRGPSKPLPNKTPMPTFKTTVPPIPGVPK